MSNSGQRERRKVTASLRYDQDIPNARYNVKLKERKILFQIDLYLWV